MYFATSKIVPALSNPYSLLLTTNYLLPIPVLPVSSIWVKILIMQQEGEGDKVPAKEKVEAMIEAQKEKSRGLKEKGYGQDEALEELKEKRGGQNNHLD